MATTSEDVIIVYLNSQTAKTSCKEEAEKWLTLGQLYKKKLWHQLTLELESFVLLSSMQKDEILIELYNKFICNFEAKINPLSLVEILAHVVNQYKDKRGAVEFLEKAEVTVKKNKVAVALCKVLKGQILLDDLNDQDKVKQIIEDIESTLESCDGITAVHSRFYLLASRLYRLQGNHAEYYRSALRYLGCTDLDSLSQFDQEQHAFFLGLAALLGEGIYNLGELLAHPVLELLRGTPNLWVIELLQAFNAGNLDSLERLKPLWSQVGDLAAQELKLRQKISLLCLMEMTFKRPANNRQLTFAEISEETHLPLDEVELLLMKALAQGLVRGSIDQVTGVVNITWVQPRVLNRSQLKKMIFRLDQWQKDVDTVGLQVQEGVTDFHA